MAINIFMIFSSEICSGNIPVCIHENYATYICILNGQYNILFTKRTDGTAKSGVGWHFRVFCWETTELRTTAKPKTPRSTQVRVLNRHHIKPNTTLPMRAASVPCCHPKNSEYSTFLRIPHQHIRCEETKRESHTQQVHILKIIRSFETRQTRGLE